MINPMTTTGDTIYAAAGGTPTRLALGSPNQALKGVGRFGLMLTQEEQHP